MRQHFELGQFLRKRYKEFLSESYDRHEVGDGFSSLLSDHMTSPLHTGGDLLIFRRRGEAGPLAVSMLHMIPTGAGIPGTCFLRGVPQSESCVSLQSNIKCLNLCMNRLM